MKNFTNLSNEAWVEFWERQPWSVYRLPDWVKRPQPKDPEAERIAKLKRAAKNRARCEGNE